jgi:MFS family permease
MAPPHRRAEGLFLLLCALNLLNYIDRAAVTGLLEPIRKDFGATDAQMGLVGSAFLLTYTLLPPVFGWLGDRLVRSKLLAVSGAIWCLATALSGATRNAVQLGLARGFVGIGEASYMANTPGLISDLYPEAKRGRMMSIFYAAAPIGAAIGVAVAGFIASHYGWRVACFLVGLPGLLLVMTLYRAPDPDRGSMDNRTGPTVPPPPILLTIRHLFRSRAFVFLALGFAGQVFVQNAVEYWLPTVLQRDKAYPIAEANATYGLMVFIAGIVGPLIGAFLGDWLLRYTRRGYHFVAALAIVGTAAPLFVILVMNGRVPVFGSVLVEALLGNAGAGLVMAIAMTQVGAEIRSTTAAVLLTTMHLLGDFISWPLVGAMSTALEEGRLPLVAKLAPLAGAAGDHHLSLALVTVTVPVAVLGAIFYLVSSISDSAKRGSLIVPEATA